MEQFTSQSKIVGVFDSGVGGLSVLQAVRLLTPAQPLVYFADQAHVPYGSRTMEEVRRFSEGVTDYMISQGARVIVVACNTASAAALHALRAKYPDIPFVGMEPAVKPAAEQTQSGVVGVLRQRRLPFRENYLLQWWSAFPGGVTVLKDTCPGLVAQIEAGELDTAETAAILENALHPMIARGVDSIVLGCTHYPFVLPLIQEIVGEDVQVIDPSMPVARQVKRVLEANGLLSEGKYRGISRFLTSGDPDQFKQSLAKLLRLKKKVEQVVWAGGKIV